MPDKLSAFSRHVGAVVIAGGRSRRMKGDWKPALPWTSGKKLLEAHISAFSPRAGSGIVCALPEERREEAGKLRLGIATSAWISDPDTPPMASFQQALRALIDEAVAGLEGAWLTPVDAPPAPTFVLEDVMDAIAENPKLWAVRPQTLDPKTGQKRGGHPVLLRRAAIDALLKLDPAEGRLDVFLRELSEDRHQFVQVDAPLILANLNEPADYKAALKLAEGKK
jgi:CTP:molybdopterin cytidylyltransferase MocA